MPMGKDGMGEMAMSLPDNTQAMMTDTRPFGRLGLGGMTSVLMVREGLTRDDYKNPGWFKHPLGTVAYEWTGEAPAASRASGENAGNAAGNVELKAVKPQGHGGHFGY
jgi:hypothetical protein